MCAGTPRARPACGPPRGRHASLSGRVQAAGVASRVHIRGPKWECLRLDPSTTPFALHTARSQSSTGSWPASLTNGLPACARARTRVTHAPQTPCRSFGWGCKQCHRIVTLCARSRRAAARASGCRAGVSCAHALSLSVILFAATATARCSSPAHHARAPRRHAHHGRAQHLRCCATPDRGFGAAVRCVHMICLVRPRAGVCARVSRASNQGPHEQQRRHPALR